MELEESKRQKNNISRSARAALMVASYNNNESLQEIGDKFGLSRQRVQQILEREGCPRRPMTVTDKFVKSHRKPKKTIDKQILVRLYEKEHLSLKEIRLRLDTSHAAIISWLDYYGIERRSAKDTKRLRRKVPELDRETLYKLFIEENLTAAAIAKRKGLAKSTVKTKLSKLRILKLSKP